MWGYCDVTKSNDDGDDDGDGDGGVVVDDDDNYDRYIVDCTTFEWICHIIREGLCA